MTRFLKLRVGMIPPRDVLLPFPTCAVCGRPVEDMIAGRDFDRDDVLVRVRCHGKVDRTRLAQELLDDSVAVLPGVAFGDQSVPARSAPG